MSDDMGLHPRDTTMHHVALRRPLLALSSAFAALAVAAAFGIAGCFSERVAADGPTGPAVGECRIPVGSPIIGATGALVAIRNFSFQPETLHVKAGTTVTWINCEPTGVDAHTSTANDGAWDSPFIAPGETYTRTFGGAGDFDYHCVPHPFMHGVVIVE